MLQETGVPIGLLTTALSGTPIEKWIEAEGFKSEPALREMELKHIAEYRKNLASHLANTDAWLKASRDAMTSYHMKITNTLFCGVTALLIMQSPVVQAAGSETDLAPVSLRCEYWENPLRIDSARKQMQYLISASSILMEDCSPQARMAGRMRPSPSVAKGHSSIRIIEITT